MPYLKKNTDPLRRLLNTYELNTGPTLARIINCSEPTARRRIEHPEDLTVIELRALVRNGHIPVDELRGAI